MSTEQDDKTKLFQVVVNQHGQYSIWPAGRPVPDGWHAASGLETRERCLAYIEEHWNLG
jgi:MbtH protein